MRRLRFYFSLIFFLLSIQYSSADPGYEERLNGGDSTYKDWYYTPTGVFGRNAIARINNRTYIKILRADHQNVSVLKYNAAGILVNTTNVKFLNGSLSQIVETNQWGDDYHFMWFKPEGQNEFIVTEKLKGQNPYTPCKSARFSFQNNLLVEILCLVDSTKPGYNQDAVSDYKIERYSDPQRFGLIKSETFYGIIDEPVISRKSDCHKIVNEYDENGDLVTKSFYGMHDEPVLNRNSIFKSKFHYDRDDNETEVDNYDFKGALSDNIFGYAQIVEEYKNGFAVKETFYNTENAVVRANRFADSVAITERRFDEKGNEIEKEYFDEEKHPINNFRGIHKTIFEYSRSGAVTAMSHFDIQSLPCSDENGIHKYAFGRDDKGRISSTAFFSIHDKPLKNRSEGVYITKIGYDAWGKVASTSFWESDSVKMLNVTGFHEKSSRYNDDGLISDLEIHDENGHPTTGRLGYSRELVEYNDKSLVAERKYYNGDKPVMIDDENSFSNHFSSIRYNYDVFNRVGSYEYFDDMGKPVNASVKLYNYNVVPCHRVELVYEGIRPMEQRVYNQENAAPAVILDCMKGNCLPSVGIGFINGRLPEKKNFSLESKTYHNFMKSDSLLFGDQLAFLGHDSILIFLDSKLSKLSERGCADYYRITPVNKYFQLDGVATDYYMENDSMAAKLSYIKGNLNGPCSYYYKNGKIKEEGAYLVNEKIGVWNYFYENGRKQKTISFTGNGSTISDCFSEDGKVLVQNGNGIFEGNVLIGATGVPGEYIIKGPVKNGLRDGEWKMYSEAMAKPVIIEKFSSGKFVRGNSISFYGGSREYTKTAISSYESFHKLEHLDHYGQSITCKYSGQPIRSDSSSISLLVSDFFPGLNKGFGYVLGTAKYKDYSGWIFLDIQFDENGHISKKYVRLYQRHDEFQKEIEKMLDIFNFQRPLVINNKSYTAEKFYVILVDSNDAVIPEEVLRNPGTFIPHKK